MFTWVILILEDIEYGIKQKINDFKKEFKEKHLIIPLVIMSIFVGVIVWILI